MQCELCHKEHDGSYGSGRFCSAKCARSFSTKNKRKEINRKVSKKLIGKPRQPSSIKSIQQQRQTLKNTLYNKYKDDKVKTYNGDLLNITKDELKEYRKVHTVCEICGKKETATAKNSTKPNRLTVDHNHQNNQFRGLLCRNCNSRLGWYENHKDIIDLYLQR